MTPQITTASEQLTFELTVTDTHGNYDTDDVNVNINTINFPPRASAGPDKRVVGGTPVTVVGTGVDPDGDELTYEWKQIYGDTISIDTIKEILST